MSVGGGRPPYPGLRSFTREETDLFFGREGCIDEMVDRLASSRFLAVLGASGSGKSSLVKAGLIDALEIGLLQQAGSHWQIAEFRPGGRPFDNLAEALVRAGAASPAGQPDEEDVRLLRTFLARGPRSLVEWCAADNFPAGVNLLILVDQFEELFRYGDYAEREEAEAFVALLLESAKAPLAEARVHVAITIRSEYLGAAAFFDGLAEAINQGLCLTPRMSRDQVREAIVGPAAVCGVEIEPALVNRLLNDLAAVAPWEDAKGGDRLREVVRRVDQLPLMQHVLNRLWSIAEARSPDGPIALQLSDYDALGGLRGALSEHGREILDGLLPEHQEMASAVFRALVTGPSLAEAVRRPTEYGELVEIAGGDEMAVREIVETFRAPGANFLLPPRPTPLRATTLIDISHESLIREWDEFAGWLQREIASAETWRRLCDALERYERGDADLLSGPPLAAMANWWDSERPTAAWAKRHGGDFDAVADFLDESRAVEEEEDQRWAEERERKPSRTRFLPLAAVIIFCIITPLTAFAVHFAARANSEAAGAREAREQARLSSEAESRAAEATRQMAEQRRLAVEVAQQAELRATAAQERADLASARADAAEEETDKQVAAAEAERKRADEERTHALAAQHEAETQAAAVETERRRALAAEQEAARLAAVAEAERQRADAASRLALASHQEATEQATLAEAERQRALAARADAEKLAAAAEAERQRADEEHARALAARADAEKLAAAAEAERQRADEEHVRALAAQQEAEKQTMIATSEGRRADEARLRALAMQRVSTQAEERAQAAADRVRQEQERAEQAQAESERANLLVESLRSELERLRAINPALLELSPAEGAEIRLGSLPDLEEDAAAIGGGVE